MKSILSNLAARVFLLLILTAAALIATDVAASAKTVKFVSQGGLQAACDKVGGYFSASGHSYFCVNGGNAVVCSDYKHKVCAVMAQVDPPKGSGVPGAAASAGLVTIPCDPMFCKIYCGGRPYCTFGALGAQAISTKLEDILPPPSLATPLEGGGNKAGPSAPAGAPSP